MPALRHAHPRTNVISHPLVSEVAMRAGGDVEAGFKPVGESLCNLHRLMDGAGRWLGSVCGKAAARSCLGTGNRVIAMQFDHSVAGWDHVGAIDLDFVIALPVHERGKEAI